MRCGLAFISRTSGSGTWNIASFHSPHSMTWRWILSFHLFKGDEARVRPLWWGYRTNGGPHWGFKIPFIGAVTWQTQQPMWFRDIYYRIRDEQDRNRYRRSEMPPLPPPSRLSVSDGGQSLH